MARFQNKTTGVVVSVDDSKADRFGPEWKQLGDDETPGAKKGKAKSGSSSKPTTIDEIVASVGTDKELAQAALEVEQTKGDKARKGLVDALEAVLAGDGDD